MLKNLLMLKKSCGIATLSLNSQGVRVFNPQGQHILSLPNLSFLFLFLPW